MGKNRYYCDFCERSFKDNVVQRKKHLSSTIHKQKRDAFYLQFKDKKQIYKENISKQPCFKFLRNGTCPFGNSCIYRHLSNKELEELRLEIGKDD